MARNIKVKVGRVQLIAGEENMDIILDGISVGRKFSPQASKDLIQALFKLTESVEGTMMKKIKEN